MPRDSIAGADRCENKGRAGQKRVIASPRTSGNNEPGLKALSWFEARRRFVTDTECLLEASDRTGTDEMNRALLPKPIA